MSRGYRTFVTGMAIGVDTWAAEECLSRRDRGEGIEVVAAIPCIGQDRRWPQASRGRYASIVSRCDRAVLVTESEYTGSCMHARDRWMVDSSGLLMAVYDGTPGGTRHTYRYAKRQGLTVARIVPAGDATTYSSPFREPAPEQCGLPLW